jgi:hypothetical protein
MVSVVVKKDSYPVACLSLPNHAIESDLETREFVVVLS